MCARRARRLLLAGFLLVIVVLVTGSVIAYRFIGPSPACKNPATGSAQPGTSARILTSSGQERCYLLHLPPGHDVSQPAPLVVSLHGFASNGEAQAMLPRWRGIADAEGFVVAFPDGTGFPLRWNAAQVFRARDVDDVQFFRDLVADVSELVVIDAQRIYVNGMSNGGAMTSRIACEAADLVAAAGTVAAVPASKLEGCSPTRPVPLIAFHGTADPLVRYEGGTFGFHGLGLEGDLSAAELEYPSVETWIAAWAERDGCEMAPDTIPASGDTSGIRYAGCDNDVQVVLYTIRDGGHTWPSGYPIPLVGRTSQDINASATMWAFFQQYTLNR